MWGLGAARFFGGFCCFTRYGSSVLGLLRAFVGWYCCPFGCLRVLFYSWCRFGGFGLCLGLWLLIVVFAFGWFGCLD